MRWSDLDEEEETVVKKKNITLISCFGVFIVLLVIYLIIHNVNKENEETAAEDEQETAYETDVDNLQSVSFLSQEGEYSFAKEDDTWNYTGDDEFPLSQDGFTEILSSLEQISSERIIEDAEDISEYELDDPVLTVTLKNADESEDVLEFGADNDMTESCYMMINQESSSIYMVPSSVKSSLQFSILDLAEIESFPTITGTTIQSVKIEDGDKVLSLSKDSDSSTGWNFTDENGTRTDANSSLVTDYMNKISAFSWSSYAAPGSRAEEYGLSSPKRITIDYQAAEESDDDSEESTTVDKEEVLLLGNTDEEGNYYAKLESQENIYILSSSSLEDVLQVTYNDFMDSYVNNYVFADLDTVTINYNNEIYEFTKKTEEVEAEDSEEDAETDSDETDGEDSEEEESSETQTVTTYYMNGEEISIDDFAEFYSLITGMEAQEWVGDETEVSSEPEITVNFHKNDGIDVTTEYYAYDSSFYLAKSSKGNSALVNKMKVKEMTDAFEEFLSKY